MNKKEQKELDALVFELFLNALDNGNSELLDFSDKALAEDMCDCSILGSYVDDEKITFKDIEASINRMRQTSEYFDEINK